MPMTPYDGVVIDPFWIDIAGRGDVEFPDRFYRLACHASYVFQLGDWKRRHREACDRKDWDALDRLDREYERIGQ